jgi:hypothetical protein
VKHPCFGTDSIPLCRAGHPLTHWPFSVTAYLWFLLGICSSALCLVVLFVPMHWILRLIVAIFLTFVAPHYFWWLLLVGLILIAACRHS